LELDSTDFCQVGKWASRGGGHGPLSPLALYPPLRNGQTDGRSDGHRFATSITVAFFMDHIVQKGVPVVRPSRGGHRRSGRTWCHKRI